MVSLRKKEQTSCWVIARKIGKVARLIIVTLGIIAVLGIWPVLFLPCVFLPILTIVGTVVYFNGRKKPVPQEFEITNGEVSQKSIPVDSSSSAPVNGEQRVEIQHHLAVDQRLGSSSFELIFAADWNKPDPVLYNAVYLFEILQQEYDHPDFRKSTITQSNKARFLLFIRNLMTNNKIFDHYKKALSNENTDQIRQMMLAIMNSFKFVLLQRHAQMA
jgi:hypothetical protein